MGFTATIPISNIGNWTFDEGSGTWANDTSGFNNNGTITGATWVTDAVNENALNFDGTNDYIDAPTSNSLNLTNAFTISGWIKRRADSGGYERIIAKSNTADGDSAYDYYIQIDSTDKLSAGFIRADGTQSYATTDTTNVPINTWLYFEWSFDGTTVTLRKNNGVVATTNASGQTVRFGNKPLNFGRLGNNGSWYYNFNGTIDEMKVYNYALNSSERTSLYQQFQPVPAYPTGGITIPATYPPLTSSVTFSWYDTEYPMDRILVARDSSFNLIIVDIITPADTYTTSLNTGQTYYWKVQQYNDTTASFGDSSDIETFTISNTQTTSGTAIQGTVYELLNGVNTPISGATVSISSAAANWSSSQTVGSNGYFLFSNLTNETTYYLNAKALGYNDGTTEYVTTGNGVWTTKDIPLTLCISGMTCYGTVNYVKFVATDFFGNLYSGLSVSVYKGADITTTYTATTGTDGAATFRLTKDQSYRLVFTGSAITSTTITITPGESILFYVFVAASTPIKWWDNTTYQEVDTVRTGVTTATVNGIAYVNVTYNDSLAQTTAWTVYLNQTNHTQPNASQRTIQSATGSGNFSQSFSIASGYTGESYLVNIVATHTTFGTIKRSFGVQFYGTKDGSLDFVPSVIMAIIAIAILIFAGAFFDSSNFAQGAGIVCVLGWIELGLGMFAYANMYISVGVGLTIASVIAIIANINERNKRETTG